MKIITKNIKDLSVIIRIFNNSTAVNALEYTKNTCARCIFLSFFISACGT